MIEFFLKNKMNKWLKIYTSTKSKPFEDQIVPDGEMVKIFQKYYPLQHFKLYRGLNFLNETDYLNFKERIKDGTLILKGISSWSKSKEIATILAKSIPHNAQLSTEKINMLIALQEMKGDTIIGYRGIILETIVSSKNALCDLSSYKGRCLDEEVLLLNGSYNVKITEEFLTCKEYIQENGSAKLIAMKFLKKREEANLSAYESDILNYIIRNNYLTESCFIEIYEQFFEHIFDYEKNSKRKKRISDLKYESSLHVINDIYFFLTSFLPYIPDSGREEIERRINKNVSTLANSQIPIGINMMTMKALEGVLNTSNIFYIRNFSDID